MPRYVPERRRNGNNRLPDRVAAGLLGIFGGTIGLQHFYMGKTSLGLLSVAFSWTGLPSIVNFIHGVVILAQDDDSYIRKNFPERLDELGMGDDSSDTYYEDVPRFQSNAHRPQLEAQPAISLQSDYTYQDVQAFQNVVREAEKLAALPHVWMVRFKNGKLAQRLDLTYFYDQIATTNGRMPTCTFQAGPLSIMFTPVQVVIKDEAQIRTWSYRDLHTQIGVDYFDEDPRWFLPQPPTGARVLQHKWLYALPDGSADPEKIDNRQIPVVEYGRLVIGNQAGPLVSFWAADAPALTELGLELEKYFERKQGLGDRTNAAF